MIVDDSALVRKVLKDVLSSDPEIQVVATAMNPVFAMRKLEMGANPDVITLDVEMPQMDGITFLKKLMEIRYIPVVMFSSLTEQGAKTTVEALRLGAFDFMAKPSGNIGASIQNLKDELIPKIKAGYKAGLQKGSIVKSFSQKTLETPVQRVLPTKTPAVKASSKIVTIGSSTGGIQALEQIIPYLPQDFPPVLIVQHMPPKFTLSFATRLDSISNMNVKEAEHNDVVKSGYVYIAPGDYHMQITSNKTIILNQDEKVNRHRPSADVLFDSAAAVLGKRAIGVILTGMGNDGAAGLLKMRNAGSYNLGQDKESCVVYGMPREAFELGAVDKVLSIEKIADELIRLV